MFKKVFQNKKGATQVLIALSMVAIFGFLTLVIDAGLLFIERSKLINVVDAAVLAGAQELPASRQSSIEKAKEYAVKNGMNINYVEVVIKDSDRKIEVNLKNRVELFFGKVLGFDIGNVVASSAAIVGPVKEVYDGVRPFAIEDQSLNFGQRVVLKEGIGKKKSNGNYGAVALGGRGACVYRNNIIYGHRGKLKVGDFIDTEPGNMTGPTIQGIDYITSRDRSTFENYSRDSLRIWTIPVIKSLDVNGRKPVEIVGFAVFFLEDAKENGGKTEITGRFIEFTTNGDTDLGQTDYGLKGIKLIK